MSKEWYDFGSKMSNSRDKVGSLNTPGAASVTPNWIIKCPEFFSCELANGYDKDSAPCLSVIQRTMRYLTYNVSGEQSGDGKVCITPFDIIIECGSWGPNIKAYLCEGKNIKEIQLIRFSSIEGTNVPIQILVCTTCKIIDYKQTGDIIEFSFIYTKITDTQIIYSLSGEKLGQTAMEFDASSVVVKMP